MDTQEVKRHGNILIKSIKDKSYTAKSNRLKGEHEAGKVSKEPPWQGIKVDILCGRREMVSNGLCFTYILI